MSRFKTIHLPCGHSFVVPRYQSSDPAEYSSASVCKPLGDGSNGIDLHPAKARRASGGWKAGRGGKS